MPLSTTPNLVTISDVLDAESELAMLQEETPHPRPGSEAERRQRELWQALQEYRLRRLIPPDPDPEGWW